MCNTFLLEIWKQIPNAVKNGPKAKIFGGVELGIQGGMKVFTIIILALLNFYIMHRF